MKLSAQGSQPKRRDEPSRADGSDRRPVRHARPLVESLGLRGREDGGLDPGAPRLADPALPAPLVVLVVEERRELNRPVCVDQ